MEKDAIQQLNAEPFLKISVLYAIAACRISFHLVNATKKNKNVWIATLCFYSLIVCCVFVCCHRATGEGGMNREEAPGKSPEDMYIQQKVRVLLMLKKMGSNVGRLSRPAATASESVLSESAEQ